MVVELEEHLKHGPLKGSRVWGTPQQIARKEGRMKDKSSRWQIISISETKTLKLRTRGLAKPKGGLRAGVPPARGAERSYGVWGRRR